MRLLTDRHRWCDGDNTNRSPPAQACQLDCIGAERRDDRAGDVRAVRFAIQHFELGANQRADTARIDESPHPDIDNDHTRVDMVRAIIHDGGVCLIGPGRDWS